MRQALTKARNHALAFLRAEAASTLTTFALMMPVLAGAVGISIDYGRAALLKTRMQAVADSAALMSARQLQLAQSTSDKVTAYANSYVASQLQGVTTAVEVDPKAYTVRVRLTSDVTRMFDVLSFQGGNMPVGASATAKLSSGLPLCLIGLDEKAPDTIALEKDALLTAPGCLVYSNSKSPQGISSKNNAVLRAGYICSAGGKVASANSNFTPQPMTDCPVMPDPLATPGRCRRTVPANTWQRSSWAGARHCSRASIAAD